jgi:DNA repair exonuclease SbcCD ATPase subunit
VAAQESTAQATASPQQYDTPETTKKDFVEYYFPGLGIDPNDPNIDWATDVPQTESARAFQRFTNSIVRIKNAMDQAKNQDVVAQMQKQAAEQLAAIEAKQQELTAQSAAELEQAKKDAAATARKEAEAKLRKLGADVSGEHADDGARKSFGQQMVEQLDDSLLQTKSGQAEYARRVEAIKQQRVRGNF